MDASPLKLIPISGYGGGRFQVPGGKKAGGFGLESVLIHRRIMLSSGFQIFRQGSAAVSQTIQAALQQAEAFLRVGKTAEVRQIAAWVAAKVGLGNPLEAVEAMRRAALLDPTSAEVALSHSRALAAAGLFDAAIAVLDDLIEAGHGNDAVVAWRGKLVSTPCFPGLQGAHAPERQVYMSAVVHMLGGTGLPVSILEVGTFMGASMVTWARAIEHFAGGIGEICCVDPWESADLSQYGEGMAADLQCGVAYRVFLNALAFVPEGIKVTERRGFSDQVLPSLAGRTFDIIYIDGCHLHPEVLHDLQACDTLLAEGGYLCGDDLEVQLHETDAAFVAAHARADFAQDPRSGEGFHPGVTLGVGTFLGPVSVYGGFWVVRKTKDGYRPVEMTGKGLLPYHWPQDFIDRAARAVREAGWLSEVL